MRVPSTPPPCPTPGPQVLCEEDGVLSAHPGLRMRLQSITLNNMGCYQCRCSKLPAALKALEAAVALDQQVTQLQQQQEQQETGGAGRRPDTWGEQAVWAFWGEHICFVPCATPGAGHMG